VGRISDAGVKLYYRDKGPEARWTLVVEEGKDGTTWRVFCPVIAFSDRAEAYATTLNAGDFVAITGKLGWAKPPATAKDPGAKGGIVVVAWQVEVLSTGTPTATEDVSDPVLAGVSDEPDVTPKARTPRRANRSRWGAGPV
jgi:hypothetical protein